MLCGKQIKQSSRQQSSGTAMDGPVICWRSPQAATGLPPRKLLPLLRAALAAAPERRDLKLQLARVLFEADLAAEIVERMRLAVADEGADPELLYYVGRAAAATGDHKLAIDALRAAAAGGFDNAFTSLGETLIAVDQIDDAIDICQAGLRHSAGNFKCLAALARVLLLRRQPERLWQLCDELRAQGAWGGYFPAVLARAAESVGRTDVVAGLLDPGRWFSATRPVLPEDFNANLAAEILAYKALGALHSTKATRGTGTWIDHLELYGGPLSQRLIGVIRTAVENYLIDRLMLADEPMMKLRRKYAELHSWAQEVRGDGHQSEHIHPRGWISGVYYVTVPTADANSPGEAGAIEFGLLSLGERNAAPRLARWRVMPEPGMLLLFPSYYAHWTHATGVAHSRISVAFDIIPADEAA
jgi:tetratricopeptide (TPR) repeat protein